MKKYIKLKKVIICILMFSLLLTIIFSNFQITNAATGLSKGDFTTFDKDKGAVSADVTGKVDKVIATVITLTRTITVAIAMVILLVIGMKYMIASPGDRADIKKHAVAYVIGAFILFGASGILTILLEFSKEIKKS